MNEYLYDILVTTIILLLVGLGIYIMFVMGYPSTCNLDQWISCSTGYQEKYSDSSIVEPSFDLGIARLFVDAQNPNPPLCLPMWFAVRYVRMSDGGYGPLSGWLGPIAAGYNEIPCYNPNGGQSSCIFCEQDGIETGGDTTKQFRFYNHLIIAGYGKLDYSPYGAEYILNVHRKVGQSQYDFEEPLDSTAEIVGIFHGSSYPNSIGSFDELGNTISNNGTSCMDKQDCCQGGYCPS